MNYFFQGNSFVRVIFDENRDRPPVSGDPALGLVKGIWACPKVGGGGE